MRLLPGLLVIAACAASAGLAASDDANDYPATIGSEPPMIGMFPGSVPDTVARNQGIPPGTGVMVLGVMPNSMAASIGLRPGDVVVSLNGQPVNSYDEIVAARDQRRAGDAAEMVFVHDGQRRSATGTLGAWPHGDDAGGMTSGRMSDLLRRASEAARQQRDADLRRGIDALRDELAALREQPDREDAKPEGPWRLEWRSRPPERTEETTEAPGDSALADATAAADGEPSWRLQWSNAAPSVKNE